MEGSVVPVVLAAGWADSTVMEAMLPAARSAASVTVGTEEAGVEGTVKDGAAAALAKEVCAKEMAVAV